MKQHQSLSSSRMANPGATVTICDLHCRFGSSQVVSGANLDILPGEHVAIVGGNGSGKTTLLRAVIGLHRQWSGHIAINGEKQKEAPAAAHPLVAWMPQRQPRGQFPYTVKELLGSSHSVEAAHCWAERLGIVQLLSHNLSTLSGGQLQRSFLARALGSLADGAGLLLADEPTAALDFQGQEQVADMLAQLPNTMLVVTHDLSLAQKCHRVLHMAQGVLRQARI